MPFVASTAAHEWFLEQDKSELILEVSNNPRNTTGYVNIKKVKGGKFQGPGAASQVEEGVGGLGRLTVDSLRP
eukprot:7151941-Prymnesium_polylepis.1